MPKGGKKKPHKPLPTGGEGVPGFTLADLDSLPEREFEAYLAAAQADLAKKKAGKAYDKAFSAAVGSDEMRTKVAVTAFWSLAARAHGVPVPLNAPHVTFGLCSQRFEWRYTEYFGPFQEDVAFLHSSGHILVVIVGTNAHHDGAMYDFVCYVSVTRPTKGAPPEHYRVSRDADVSRLLDRDARRINASYEGQPTRLFLTETLKDPKVRAAVQRDWEPLLPSTRFHRERIHKLHITELPTYQYNTRRVYWLQGTREQKNSVPILLMPNGVTRRHDGFSAECGAPEREVPGFRVSL